jgi:murein DD-endopeptidase MepM/ murein hydrolase activator NlpD
VICPSIRQDHFEVDQDVYDEFAKAYPEIIEEITEKKGGKFHIDTVRCNTWLLERAGVKMENIIDSGLCTVCHKDLINSYRGNIESGRKTVDEVVEVPAVAQVVLRGTKSKPTYMFPVTNWNVTSNFGYRWGRLHAGTDVGVPQGTTVRASRGGQVITAGWVGGYGNCVIIDHGDGVSTRYGHLSQVLVSVGQYVDQGDQIALSGNTGRSTGPHLHFEIRINGEAVDPLPYLYQ